MNAKSIASKKVCVLLCDLGAHLRVLSDTEITL